MKKGRMPSRHPPSHHRPGGKGGDTLAVGKISPAAGSPGARGGTREVCYIIRQPRSGEAGHFQSELTVASSARECCAQGRRAAARP